MADNKNTQYFKVNNETDIAVKDILEAVYIALTEKGYNPVNQIVGYVRRSDICDELQECKIPDHEG